MWFVGYMGVLHGWFHAQCNFQNWHVGIAMSSYMHNVIFKITCGYCKVGLQDIISIKNFLQSNIRVYASIMNVL
jgi:hypothetical protein